MPSIDLHCDTLTSLLPWEDLNHNHLMVSIPKLRKADSLVQCCAIFVPTGTYPEQKRDALAHRRYDRVLASYHRVLRRNEVDIAPVLKYEDIEMCRMTGKIGVLLTVEDGGAIGAELADFQRAYMQGVRLVTLTWNHPNRIGFPHSPDAALMQKGLTPFGIQVIEEMEQLGMIVDVSHLSDGGFWDVVKYTKKPFVASHSNSRAITGHSRNLSDEMIRCLADRGGVIGLNYFPGFLCEGKLSRITDMVRHVLHIRDVGGEDVLALGGDFDGIYDNFADKIVGGVTGRMELAGPQAVSKLYNALRKAGLSERELEKMWTGNALRIFRELL